LIGGTAVATVALSFAFTWISYRTAVLGGASGAVLHPRRIESPFSLGKSTKASEFAETLRLSVYPGSIANESTLSRWLPAPNPKTGKGEGVSFLRLRAAIPPAQAAAWYKSQLGPNFVMKEGNLAAAVQGSEDWLSRVSANPNAEAILFLRSELGIREGVILEPGHGNAVLITIFRYSGI
jgi:hypothetical protein